MMHPIRSQILSLLRKEDILLQQLWDRWQMLDPNKLHMLPPNEGWTLMQAAAHLCQAEMLALTYVKKKSQSEHLVQGVHQSSLRLMALKLVLALPIKFKAPKVVSVPPHYETMELLIHDWKSTREELRHFIEHLEESKLNKSFFKHPAAGMLTPIDMARFFLYHLNHHLRQYQRLERKINNQ